MGGKVLDGEAYRSVDDPHDVRHRACATVLHHNLRVRGKAVVTGKHTSLSGTYPQIRILEVAPIVFDNKGTVGQSDGIVLPAVLIWHN